MTRQFSNWQEIKLEFFRERVFPLFWNHIGKTVKKVIEIQYMPGLYCKEPERRAFIGAGITLDFPYSTRPENLKATLLKEGNLGALREYEKEHALGFVITGDENYKVDCVTLCYTVREPLPIFMQNFGVGYSKSTHPIFLWYN